ncbi:RNA polymerase sigma factor [bacterium]|nr:RNA polymerase sigma factor [bacterium]
MEEKEAIALIKKGDNHGFNFIYDKYIYQIYGYLYHMVKDKMIAEDIASEVFFKLYKNIRKYEERGNFRSYIFRIAHNMAVDYFKKNKIMFSYRDDLKIKDEPEETDDEKRFFLKKLEEKLSSMGEKERELIMFYYFEEMSLKEIGIILGIKENAAKTALFRARQKLIKEVKNAI